MINEIHIRGFKSLRDVKLRTGHLNLLIGANSSGKSNLLEAFRVIQGLALGLPIDAVLDGRPKGSRGDAWEAIRGGSAFVGFNSRTAGASSNSVIEFAITAQLQSGSTAHHVIAIDTMPLSIHEEKFTVDSRTIASTKSDPLHKSSALYLFEEDGKTLRGGVHPSYSWIGLLSDIEISPTQSKVSDYSLILRGMQRLSPTPVVLRQYASHELVPRMGENGENFAGIVNTILGNQTAIEPYLAWLKQLTPYEVEGVNILKGALGEPLFAIVERGQERPAPVLSDGTLRFAAISAAFFQQDLPSMLFLEEIETGIHPSRLRLLVELLKTQSKRTNTQVFATTHSPTVLAWLEEEDYATTFLCKRDSETGESIIKPLSEIPDIARVIQTKRISDLFLDEWLEDAL